MLTSKEWFTTFWLFLLALVRCSSFVFFVRTSYIHRVCPPFFGTLLIDLLCFPIKKVCGGGGGGSGSLQMGKIKAKSW